MQKEFVSFQTVWRCSLFGIFPKHFIVQAASDFSPNANVQALKLSPQAR